MNKNKPSQSLPDLESLCQCGICTKKAQYVGQQVINTLPCTQNITVSKRQACVGEQVEGVHDEQGQVLVHPACTEHSHGLLVGYYDP